MISSAPKPAFSTLLWSWGGDAANHTSLLYPLPCPNSPSGPPLGMELGAGVEGDLKAEEKSGLAVGCPCQRKPARSFHPNSSRLGVPRTGPLAPGRDLLQLRAALLQRSELQFLKPLLRAPEAPTLAGGAPPLSFQFPKPPISFPFVVPALGFAKISRCPLVPL